MSCIVRCADCGLVGDDADCTVIDQEQLLQSIMSGEITTEEFIEAGSEIGRTVCPSCSSPELEPLDDVGYLEEG